MPFPLVMAPGAAAALTGKAAGAGLFGKIMTGGTLAAGAAVAAPTVSNVVTGGFGNDMFEQILNEGPRKNQATGEYEFSPNIFQRQFINEENLLPRWNEAQQAIVSADPRVLQMEAVLGPGSITSQLAANTKATPEEINRLLGAAMPEFKTKKREQERETTRQNQRDIFNDPTNVAIRETQATERELLRNERLQNRLDRLDDAQAARDIQRLRLGSEERMFDKRLAYEARADKKQRMQAIIAGLANLGGAFVL